MFKHGIAKALVDGLPPYINAPDIPTVDKDLLRVVEIVPSRKPAFYGDDKWDFSSCFKYITDSRCIIDFSSCIPQAKQPMKDYALDRLEAGNKVQTVSSYVTNMNGCLKRMTAETGIPFLLLTAKSIIEYIESQNCKFCTKTALASLMHHLFKVMTDNGQPHLVDKDALKRYYMEVRENAKHEEKNHFKVVPERYLNLLVTMLDQIMRDESKPYDQRMTAGISLIDTQMGMRISEIPIMPVDCMRWAITSRGKMPYVVYRSQKAARFSREFVEVEHMGTELLFQTLDYYLELRSSSPHAGEEFLYVDESSDRYPISKDVLERRYHYLVKQYMPESKEYTEGVNPYRFRDGDIRFIPSFHCLRSTVISAMANYGVPYPFIEKMVSHTPGTMCDDSYYTGVKTPKNTVWNELND